MMPENCIQFEARMNELLDRRSSFSRDAIIQQHAQECPNCARWLAAQTKINQCMAEFNRVELEPNQTRSKQRMDASSYWLVAATICIAVLSITASFLSFDRPVPVAQLAPPVPSQNIVSPVVVAPDLSESNDELETLYTINSLATSLLMMDDLLPEEITQRIEQAADPIRPLTDSVSSTINVLRRTISVGSKKKFDDPHTSSFPPSLVDPTEMA